MAVRLCVTHVAAVIVSLAVVGVVAAQPGAAPAPPVIEAPMQPRAVVEELTLLLRARIGDRDSRRRDRTLTGLREMRDPAMLAFFAQLSINPSAQLRAHGLLGLAELEPQRGLDLLAVSRIAEQRLQGVIVSDAFAAGLLGDAARSELSGWASLPVRLRLDLAADCAARSLPFDVASVQGFLADPDGFTAVAAAAVLRQASVEATATEQAIRTRTAGLTLGNSGAAAAELADFVVRHDLTLAGEALDIAASALKPGAAADAVTAARLLTTPGDPIVVRAARARLDIAVPAVDRAAFGVRVLDVALRLGTRTPRAVVGEMETDPDPLVKAIGVASAALAADGGTVGTAVGALARRGHVPTVEWALRCAAGRHWQDARTIRAAVIDGVARRSPGSSIDPQLSDMAVRAAESLCDDDPRSLDRPLAEALSAADGELTRIILEGALRSGHDKAGALVRQGAFEVRPTGPWPTVDAAALALLVAVRHNEFTADPSERIARLSAIARTDRAGGLSGILRAQAAWLALRASGEDRVALTRILSDLPAPSADTPVQPPSTSPTAAPAPHPPVNKP
jgi:hypothetical protein